MNSRIPGFYRLTPVDRLAALKASGAIDEADAEVYADHRLEDDVATVMVENVVSTFALPCGVAVNFRINGHDVVVPMVVEEPSVVAACTNMAQLTRKAGGITTSTDASVMIGQVQLEKVSDPDAAVAALKGATDELAEIVHATHPRLIARGGGLRGFEVRHVVYDEPGFPREDMVVLHFHLDCVDAMGANMVNTVAEALSPKVEELTGERVALRILSNLADQRLARASVKIPFELLTTGDMDGREVAQGIAAAWRFAWADPYRATTHNKGVMNGIDSVALATGNDWRAIEAGAHAWAARSGTYRPMTVWRVEEDGLHGSIELPMQFGTVGGPLRVHKKAQANLRMLGNPKAGELAQVAVAVGLAQNLGALKALSTTGIQAGHMRMHARSVAAGAGATETEIPRVVAALFARKEFSIPAARSVLSELRG